MADKIKKAIAANGSPDASPPASTRPNLALWLIPTLTGLYLFAGLLAYSTRG